MDMIWDMCLGHIIWPKSLDALMHIKQFQPQQCNSKKRDACQHASCPCHAQSHYSAGHIIWQSIMPPHRNTAMQQETSYWKRGDNAKLNKLIQTGKVHLKDHSCTALKKIHQELPNKSYKSFTTHPWKAWEDLCCTHNWQSQETTSPAWWSRYIIYWLIVDSLWFKFSSLQLFITL